MPEPPAPNMEPKSMPPIAPPSKPPARPRPKLDFLLVPPVFLFVLVGAVLFGADRLKERPPLRERASAYSASMLILTTEREKKIKKNGVNRLNNMCMSFYLQSCNFELIEAATR